jgi:thiamine-phosphate pyrophosphorylase
VKSLEHARLYGIADLGYVPEADLERVVEAMCAGGVDLLQLRAKGYCESQIEEFGCRIEPVTRAAGVPLIINDFPELVPTIGAQGAHTGQDDRSVSDARWRAGRTLSGEIEPPIIGRSTHSIVQAIQATEDGADYLGFGPLFATPTKPGRPAIGLADICEVHARVSVPIFCIGGIHLDNLQAVIDAGAQRIVVVSAILQAKDIQGYCRELKSRLPL